MIASGKKSKVNCEYCQQTKPVKVFASSCSGSLETNPFAYDVLMRQVTIDDKFLWVCSECGRDT